MIGSKNSAIKIRRRQQKEDTRKMKKGLFNKSKTFKPRKQHAKGTKRYELHKKAKLTLGSGDLRLAVALPAGEELNEWLAVNTVVRSLSSSFLGSP